LSARVLAIHFYNSKETVFRDYEDYLKTLGFEDYKSEDNTAECLKKVDGDIVYSFCYDPQQDYADWEISTKDFFDALVE
jgi:hypothetical protein